MDARERGERCFKTRDAPLFPNGTGKPCGNGSSANSSSLLSTTYHSPTHLHRSHLTDSRVQGHVAAMSTFDALIADLSRDAHRAQPKDALQFCASWFQTRLEEQRARMRDALMSQQQQSGRNVPGELYADSSSFTGRPSSPFLSHLHQVLPPLPPNVAPTSGRNSARGSIAPSPFGTLNVPGNALLSGKTSQFHRNNSIAGLPGLPPPAPGAPNPFASFAQNPPLTNPGDYLQPPLNSAIFARRQSVSAESIMVDSATSKVLPVFPKTEEQVERIKHSIDGNFIFRNLDDEQTSGVLNALKEKKAAKGEVVIRQGDAGDYFYVVESGLLDCFIRPDPLPPTWLEEGYSKNMRQEDKFLQEGHHPEFGKKVSECLPGHSFGELALMYGHPRAATVVATEDSTLWALDRITFRTIILNAAHRRRTMYENFLSGVTLLSSLDAAEKSKIADALVSRVVQDGDAVVKQGEMGDTFFFVEEGEAVCTQTITEDDGSQREMKVGHLRKGDYFGGTFNASHFVALHADLPLRTVPTSNGTSCSNSQCFRTGRR